MKNKYILSIYILGGIIIFIGALLKVNHFEFIHFITGNLLLGIGLLIQVLAGILFVFKIITNKKNKFLNS